MSDFIPVGQRPTITLDIETTGLDPNIHEIVEFACWRTDLNVGITFKVKPEHPETASPQAIEVSGYSEAEWEGAKTQEEAATLIVEAIGNAVIIGQNVSFDMGFIKPLVARYLPDVQLPYHKVDTATLAYEHLVPIGLKSLSLHYICEFLGIPNEGEHRALADVKRTKAVYDALIRATWFDRLRWRLRNRSKG
jgi:DNA polymerase III epsilon subunit-like protein